MLPAVAILGLLATLIPSSSASALQTGGVNRDGFRDAYHAVITLREGFQNPNASSSQIENLSAGVLKELARTRSLVRTPQESAFMWAAAEAARDARVLAEELDEPSNFADDLDRRRSRDVLAALILTVEDRLVEANELFSETQPGENHSGAIACLETDAEADQPAQPVSAIDVDSSELQGCREVEMLHVWGSVGPGKFFANETERRGFAGFIAAVVGADALAVKVSGHEMILAAAYRCSHE